MELFRVHAEERAADEDVIIHDGADDPGPGDDDAPFDDDEEDED